MRRRQTMKVEGLRRMESSDNASSRRIRVLQDTSSSGTPGPVSSGWVEVDSSVDEIELQKADIEGLQELENENMNIDINYACMPNKEEVSKLRASAFTEPKEIICDSSGNHCAPDVHLYHIPVKAEKESTVAGHDVSNGYSNWVSESESVFWNLQTNDMEPKKFQDQGNAFPILRSYHEKEIKKLKILLHKEREISASMELQLKEKHKQNESAVKELHHLKMEKQKEKEEMTNSIRQLEKNLKNACDERDNIPGEFAQIKQEMLDKEFQKSENMNAWNKIISELREDSEYQKRHIVELEKVLKHEASKFKEMEKIKDDEIQKLNEMITSLNQKLEDCIKTVTSKNSELLNLRCTLQQYYADTESKKLQEMDLALSREESAKLSELLKVANEEVDKCRREKSEMYSKLLETEVMVSQSNCTIQNLQEENTKLHKIVEESMMKLNKMSTDFSYFIDRRIIIKLLITYFQKNHCKEVLNLIVRILGFSEEDKKKIGFARETAGKMVSGVLSLPNFLAGGIFKESVPRISSQEHSDNQSFGNLWVDFLLKEGDQRNQRETYQDEAEPSLCQEESSSSQSAD